MDATSLYLGLLFGSVGFAYFMYGKKQRRAIPLLCGFALMGLPYLIVNIQFLVILGIAIAALPMLARD